MLFFLWYLDPINGKPPPKKPAYRYRELVITVRYLKVAGHLYLKC